jgi:hypothetical protein
MLSLLRHVPDADLTKLQTVEASTENLSPGEFPRVDLCFIDGEHTRGAALRDARWCNSVIRGAGIITFHDHGIIAPAILDFLREISRPHRGFLLRDSVFVVELGAIPTMLGRGSIRDQMRRGWLTANRMRGDTLMTAADIVRRRLEGKRRLG